MDVLRLPIRIKAKDKVMKFDVVLNPIFFSFYKGFEVKVIEGPLSGSIFCCKISDFEYNLYGKFQIWILWKFIGLGMFLETYKILLRLSGKNVFQKK